MRIAIPALAGMLCGACVLSAEDNAPGVTGVEAVASKVSSDYTRPKLADGTFTPEFYSFGKGGNWGGEFRDVTIDKLDFLDVAHAIAPALHSQKYIPATDPYKTKLLVMVYWGTTAVPEPAQNSTAYEETRTAMYAMGTPKAATSSKGYHALSSGNSTTGNDAGDGALAAWSSAMTMLNMINQQRTKNDFMNAQMLGYDAPGLVGTDYGNNVKGTAMATTRDDLFQEIEENRYFVVLMAYDFQLLWKQKKHKLLWESRFSVSQRHNEFDRALPAMAQYAARYFGQPTNGLIRQRLLNDNVQIGEPTLIQFLSEPKK